MSFCDERCPCASLENANKLASHLFRLVRIEIQRACPQLRSDVAEEHTTGVPQAMASMTVKPKSFIDRRTGYREPE